VAVRRHEPRLGPWQRRASDTGVTAPREDDCMPRVSSGVSAGVFVGVSPGVLETPAETRPLDPLTAQLRGYIRRLATNPDSCIHEGSRYPLGENRQCRGREVGRNPGRGQERSCMRVSLPTTLCPGPLRVVAYTG
jgi:hypothetical protein